MIELNVRFTSSDRFVIKFDDRETDTLEFKAPVNDGDRAEMRWYLESYAAHYMMDVDDRRAERIEAQLPKWGEALFEAIFSGGDAKEIFNDFQNSDERDKILTISASHPLILALPWELLCDSKGNYLSHGDKPISIRRSFWQLTNESEFKQDLIKQNIVPPKNRLCLLFVISRPIDAGFLDPRKDALATLEAIAINAQGLIDVEFLRPPTLDKLVERLADKSLPSADIVHFDGHGVFDVNKNIGYLMFEDIGGNGDRVSAAQVGASLSQAGISAMLLSACQTAAVAGEEAMGSVAIGLTYAGIPTVLAMQYSVLTSTTEQMFGAFYEHLTQGQRFGEALENARRYLYAHRERGDRQRGRDRVTLRLQDWFLPALYQVGSDRALFNPKISPHPQPLSQGARGEEENPDLLSPSTSGRGARGEGNLSEVQKAGFWGRAWELWQIERAYVRDTRRVTISGFGGMGKTYLAEEVGRWLLRTGMFARVCLVGYANFQGIDTVSYAVSVLATVLETNLIDAAAVTRVLADQSVLVILDNLESLDAEQLVSLLDAAKEWSEAGESRVLLTTRAPDLCHRDYPNYPIAIGRRSRHVSLQLEGLQPDDAVNYFQSLLKLPPAPRLDLPFREDLLALFELVQRLPLAIGLLAAQLKDRQVLDVRKELEELMVQSPDNPLLASLNLSINRLNPEMQEWIKRLGVFQGGAFENNLIKIIEIDQKEWHLMKMQLEIAGLMQSESLNHLGISVPFLKFHPTLAPAMWARMNEPEQQQLLSRYYQRYFQVSEYLYFEDCKHSFTSIAIAQRELFNLIEAVHGVVQVGNELSAQFCECVNTILRQFGLDKEQKKLAKAMQKMSGKVGSQIWFLTLNSQGEELRNTGFYAKAKIIFQEILAGLCTTSNYSRSLTLGNLGRCYRAMGQPHRSISLYFQSLEQLAKLEQNNLVRRELGVIHTDLGDALKDIGEFTCAQQSYEISLKIDKELNDFRGQAITQGQLGTLAMAQKNFFEAAKNYQEVLQIFQKLNQPISEAIAWHQLGRCFEESYQWEKAECAYRKSAALKETHGLISGLNGASKTWYHLAIVNEGMGKEKEAEAWYSKVIEVDQELDSKVDMAKDLNNLANLLQLDPMRLEEAQHLAEKALAIDKTLDPEAAELWTTYNILAQIRDKQGDPAKAKEYRRLSRDALANFAGTEYELRQHAQLIEGVVMAVDDAEVRQQLETELQEVDPEGQNILWNAIRQILNGERDEDILCEGLNDNIGSQIVLAILDQVKR